MTRESMSRRSFLGLGALAAAGVGAAGLAGCAPAASGNSEAALSETGTEGTAAASGQPAFMTAPAVPTDVADTKDCDVLVLGLGLSGICAARAASEAGVKVIGVEKQEQLGVIGMAGDFGIYGSKIQKDLGMELASKGEVVNQLMKDMTFRPNARLLGYWYDHSGEDFDWLVEGADYEVVPTSATPASGEKEYVVRPKCFPVLEGYDRSTELFPFFNGTVTTEPSVGWCMESSQALAEGNGAEFLFGTFAEQLIKDDSGRVTGAYVRDKSGTYTQINAKNGVILCCGDISGNPEMLNYYVPWVENIAPFYPNIDVEGNVANTGDGHRMGMWAGGHMELGPLAPMTHHMGAALGVDAFLQLNVNGERFMNEDIPGQNIQDQLSRQPEARSWQIIDAKWPEQLACQGTGHGYVNYYIPDAEADKWAAVVGDDFSASFSGYTTDKMFLDAITHQADTIEELAEKMGVPVETMVASVERYNELAKKGVDEDFGKRADRMFPLENPPYYACEFGDAGMLVCMGGLDCDLDLHVLNDEMQPIPGLYVAGNNMGGRYLVEYPVTEAGISLATALVFGRLAGMNAAAAK
ncbi:FAD-binding protein [uncultured Adlercreutzia sp.]|uniref:FAD-dependent oxidoreductase n=2 Tax=uncultured Adlercreutzia sp. TaxID=875803 RepID=UPI0025ED2892|nr:FAD-binding protein [uncultured Adlercreutzia sp.]MCI9261604.1 FAD-binding protein [Eggerthellaceae bacterium]